MIDYYVRYIDLPYTIKGMTVQDINGFYNVYINSRLSFEEQRKALKHELEHISRHDFDHEEMPLEMVEAM